MQREGLQLTGQLHYAVHHRRDWSGIDTALLNGVKYEITDINPDTSNLPTSYDLIVLKKVVKHG